MANGRKPIPQAGGGSGNNGNQASRRYAGGRGYRRRPASSQTDEQILIQFMSFMRHQHPNALRIHQQYGADQAAFIHAAREFLASNPKENDSIPARKVEKLVVGNDPVYDESNIPSKVVAPIQRSPPSRSPVPIRSSSPAHLTDQDQLSSSLKQLLSLNSNGFEEPRVNALNKTIQPTLVESTESPDPSFLPILPQTMHSTLTEAKSLTLNEVSSVPSAVKPAPSGIMTHQQQQQQLQQTIGNWKPTNPGMNQSQPANAIALDTQPVEDSTTPKPVYQPKRVWTRLEEQPGRLLANNIAADGPVITLRPRQELTAKWILPIKFVQDRMLSSNKEWQNIRDALKDLTVGLFRRGCTENGTNASIISKEVLAPSDENRNDYPYTVDESSGFIVGTIPFYAPRTPGHVLFRLYWQNDTLYTLATGPTLYVHVTDEDTEPTLRFILSNFKSRKGTSTSLSSLHALSSVLEQFNPKSRLDWDGAGRAAWGCVCESRKILEICATEYDKGKERLRKLQEEIEVIESQLDKEAVEGEEEDSTIIISVDNAIDDSIEKSGKLKIKEKMNLLMAGRASNDRKWKDAQVAFASILEAIIFNPASSLLFRRELLAKIRLEYELWCSLCEGFASSPFNSTEKSFVEFSQFPQHVTSEHLKLCTESRRKMQTSILGFAPEKKTLEETLYKKSNPSIMDSTVVSSFNMMSSAMGKLFEKEYLVRDHTHQQRELVRAHVERIVAQCDAFPPGTRVLIFGSSANGFGSPTSDLDMCLQPPPNTTLSGEIDDATGSKAMAKLADLLEQNNMQNVDTIRLTARIPVIKFNCPRPMAQNGEDENMECDLSFVNSLAVLNTSLLSTYAMIHPVTRILAAVIKRWAKARDINNPSKHSLSSYGYIIMLLHFLTYHRRTGNGLISSLDNKSKSNFSTEFGPLLPNLQWMDPKWLLSSNGQIPYTEFEKIPIQLIKHPLEDKVMVNTYFHRINNAQQLSELQRRFPSRDLSLAILLTTFFRYFAFEFDYKRHIVSLHSHGRTGILEREIKAEYNGWKVYSTGLAIEDPFETFYDVAHVVKGSNFHRLRNEMALAYTKIIDAVESGRIEKNGMDLIDLICEPIQDESAT